MSDARRGRVKNLQHGTIEPYNRKLALILSLSSSLLTVKYLDLYTGVLP